MEIEVGDMILLCSDGVYGNGKSSKIEEALKGETSGADLLPDIFDIAKENAHDNFPPYLSA